MRGAAVAPGERTGTRRMRERAPDGIAAVSGTKRKYVPKAPPKWADKCAFCGRPPVRQLDSGDRLCAVHSARLDEVETMARDRRAGYARTGA